MFASGKKRELIGVSLVAVFCALGVGLLQVPQLKQLSASKKNVSVATLKQEEQSEKVQLNLLKQLPTFGFDNLMADWVFINFLQYFGDDEVREKTGYNLSPEYFEVILSRDPRFLQAYLFLSTSTSMYGAMPERSVALMNQGLKSVTPQVPAKSYYIWRYKAIDELLFLGDGKAAKQSFETAAKWAESYTDEESKQVAAVSRGTAKFLERKTDSKAAQIAAWIVVLSNPIDDKTRQSVIERIQALGGKIVRNPQGGFGVQLPKED